MKKNLRLQTFYSKNAMNYKHKNVYTVCMGIILKLIAKGKIIQFKLKGKTF